MSKRFTCPACGWLHAISAHPQSLRNVVLNGELFCISCGKRWFVATIPSGVVPRVGDEVHAWLNNWAELGDDVWPAGELIGRMIADYTAHANQRISLEEPTAE